MRAALPGEILSLEATHVADVTAAVGFRVGVNDFAVETRAGNAEPVTLSHQRRRIHREDDHITCARSPHERNNAVIRIMEINPLETFVGVVEFPKRGLGLVDVVQMLHEPTQAIVTRQSDQFPIKAAVVIPLASQWPRSEEHTSEL